MVNSRMTAILKELMSATSTVTSDELAIIIQVTSRTIRNDIKELNEMMSRYGSEIKSTRGSGYRLVVHDHQKYLVFLKEHIQKEAVQRENIPSVPEDRVHYLVRRLLLAEGFVKMEDLADELFISKSTIQYDIRQVRNIFEKYGITFESRPNYGIKLSGTEQKMRFCMSEFIFNHIDYQPDEDRLTIAILTDEDMIFIRKTVVEQIKKHDISLSDIGLKNLVVHIAIACKRIQEGNVVALNSEEMLEVRKAREYSVAKEIIEQLEVGLHASFPEQEIAYITLHLLGTRLVAHLNPEEPNFQQFIDHQTYELTSQILEAIEKKLHTGIETDQELIMAMSLHLKPAVNRFRYGMNIRNPMLSDIKSNYPIAFEAGIIAGTVIKKQTNIEINEHEIGYLALHIGAAMERRKMKIRPKKCLVVCATGIGSSRLLSYKLQAKFGSRVEIVGTSEYYKLHEYPLHTLDFIVSTIPIQSVLPVPVIEVKAFLGESDFDKVEEVLHENDNEHVEYTKQELVFLQEKWQSRDQVLSFLSEKLQQLGLVDDQFITSVLERESLSPTSFGNLVAIPHPAVPQTNTTFWAICTLQKPILWGEERVQFVCLLSVEKNSTDDLQKMYKLLGSVVDDSSKVQRLVKCKTYQEFVTVFLNG